ncbi:molybdate ABC transporter substrate-binding protein [Telmatospirillum sp.]|uniref:molybdate ABC transporter substrate-binding protein n=1 Tax=Telmatospirillum sp. TaxID=2079197 RepID=UPI00283C52F2|nr:molybdate ABC transporter substrate-binding protein [Telmatospirillum sp.]MDR3437913.1 molybdate ABC transporter substrate-binding protein [Telmatospirillum sp.]
MGGWRRWTLAAAVLWMASTVGASADVVVYAPGAMGEALEQVAAASGQAGKPFKLVVGHSPAQARQIADGAPADIFISADPQWMDFLTAKHLLAEEPPVSLASTRLVLVAPVGSAFAYAGRPGENLSAGIGEGKLAIADPDTMPAGRFARAALEKLGQWQALQGRLATLDHVRAVVAMVEHNEVPLGIGFASDVAGDPKVRLVTEFAPDVAPSLEFPLAVVAGHERDDVAAVAAFLKGPETLAILHARGFADPSR